VAEVVGAVAVQLMIPAPPFDIRLFFPATTILLYWFSYSYYHGGGDDDDDDDDDDGSFK
jgi:hypothetical protein